MDRNGFCKFPAIEYICRPITIKKNKDWQMKKQLFFFAVLMSAVIGLQAQRYDFSAPCSTGKTLYYSIIEGSRVAVVAPNGWDENAYTDYPQPSGSLVIPSSVASGGQEYTVVSIGEHAFWGCRSLSSLVMPNTIEVVENAAFFNCTNLADIVWGTNIGNFGWSMVEGTAWFDSKPDGPIYIGPNLLYYKGEMPQNTVLTVAEGTTRICGLSVTNKQNLVGLILPSTLRTIDYYAFSGCTNLESVTLPASLEGIDRAFVGCSSLQNYYVDDANPQYIQLMVSFAQRMERNWFWCPTDVPERSHSLPA